MKPSIAEQIESARRAIAETRGILACSTAADLARRNGKESALTIGARWELAAREAILATLSQHEALEAVAEVARRMLLTSNVVGPGRLSGHINGIRDALAALDAAETEKR